MDGDRNEVFYVGGSAKITVYNIKNGEARTGNTKFLDYMQKVSPMRRCYYIRDTRRCMML